MHRTIHLLSTANPILSDLLALTLIPDPTAIWQTRLTQDVSESTIGTLTFSNAVNIEITEELTGTCVTCAIRTALISFLHNPYTRSNELFVILPPGVELPHLCPTFAADLKSIDVTLGAVTHALDATNATSELLAHIPLAERGAQLIDDDERCLAEIHAINMGYADLILLCGDHNSPGGELVEHLRPHDTLLAHPFEDNIAELVISIDHDPQRALARIHPSTLQAWGGPQTHGTWTLDLTSSKALHPERLFDFAQTLSDLEVYARGCFWVPARPDVVCAWDALGTHVAISNAGNWETPSEASTHIVVVGQGEETMAQHIEDAFAHALATETDMLFAEPDDGLDQWLGENVTEE
ncbi:cobalamin biosynthesis protein CobW [Arcanobacterium phocisimile]|uniref:Cobalamin biosynthesis protein CobW n=1 Tax=Arcanobacterium phocisimile TaxID=1302235 RepID=A0ABX7II70_9ACTO|nr:GTP-binding protein [Arcanobacterium phocisimile]QRV02657.1 cobalamin biosynthesis protein CobW [Arcanobacterium phocisimile]